MAQSKWLRKILLVSCSLGLTLAGSADAAGRLVSSLEPVASALKAQDDVVVRWSLTNEGTERAYILKYQTPLFGIEHNMFAISRDGEPARYLGKTYKRLAPTAKDFMALAPGQTVSKEVELSSVYDLGRGGEYAIQYAVDLSESLHPARLGGDFDFVEELSSNIVAVVRHGGAGLADENHLLEERLPADEPSFAFRYLTPSFVSCSSTRQSSILSALSQAQTYAGNSLSYLNAGTTGTRYTRWFGTYTSSRYSTVRTHFNSINSTILNQRITFNCSCTDPYYAYVYPGSPYTIYLCNAFWSAPTSGTDSKAGTIIHELSHFYVVASTDDWAYGQTACRSLATSNPTRAVDNADSHEYFAENTPFLN